MVILWDYARMGNRGGGAELGTETHSPRSMDPSISENILLLRWVKDFMGWMKDMGRRSVITGMGVVMRIWCIGPLPRIHLGRMRVCPMPVAREDCVPVVGAHRSAGAVRNRAGD